MNIHIIGAGITGLSTALALQKTGFSNFTLFERAAELNEVGAGIMMQPNAMKILDWLGIGDAIRSAGQALNFADITDQHLRSFRKNHPSLLSGDRSQQIIAIHRGRLQRVLYEALPTGKVELDMPLVDCTDKHTQVKAIFEKKIALSDLLLGADGIHSVVRKNCFANTSLRYSGQTCWRGIADMELPLPLRHTAKEAWGSRLRFGFAPISDREVYWYAVANEPAGGKDKSGFRKALLDRFASFHPLISDIIQLTPDAKIIRNDIYDLKRLATWHKGRITLIGDAAHATTPNMGQGACQGIEDAYYLSQLLAYESSIEQALSAFEALRRKKVDHIVNTSWQLGQAAHHPIGQQLVKWMMRIAPSKTINRQMQQIFSIQEMDVIS
ncbi:MAG TPA: FAD-dependent monooxygenase [Saprospiraceae bacterium]|nr:FAD-dependent monooxygenase [Saprospiraceae bacterium]HMQ82699.1 FAD-dependent monooxygenase [Saprospiraceae bacterium]